VETPRRKVRGGGDGALIRGGGVGGFQYRDDGVKKRKGGWMRLQNSSQCGVGKKCVIKRGNTEKTEEKAESNVVRERTV